MDYSGNRKCQLSTPERMNGAHLGTTAENNTRTSLITVKTDRWHFASKKKNISYSLLRERNENEGLQVVASD
jgi:hypothetical protein